MPLILKPAPIKKSVKILAEAQALHYEAELLKEINEDREAHGKKPFEDDDDDDKPEGNSKERNRSKYNRSRIRNVP